MTEISKGMYEISLTHSIDAAHRVVGHEGGRGKCARLHGHTYLFEVTLRGPKLDETGFIVDFARIKDVLNWCDHRTMLWTEDPIYDALVADGWQESLVAMAFNPTAENLARYFAETFAAIPGVAEAEVVCRETAKSAARWVARAPQVAA